MFAKKFRAAILKVALCCGGTWTLVGCAASEPPPIAAGAPEGADMIVRTLPHKEGDDEYSMSATATMIPSSSEWLAACEDWDEWDKPGPPFRIYGNTFYVGTCGIGAILILSEDGPDGDDRGHILIDSGTEAGADVVLENIRTLGIDPQEISVLLSSHEHFDHVGGMAKLQEATGADVFAVAPAAKVLSTGRDDPADPQFGMHPTMAPVRIARVLANNENVVLGALSIVPIPTPGHTPGAMSWQWKECEDDVCKMIIYADSLSPVSSDDYRFSDHPDYVAAYRQGLADLAAAECDILITPHPSSSEMPERMDSEYGLIMNRGCGWYPESIEARLDKRLAEEGAETANGR